MSASDILRKLIYTDDLAVVADSEADLQERLIEWKEVFGRHRLRVRKKMEVLWVGQRKNCRHQTGWDETEPTRQLCIFERSILRGRRHGDGNSQENTSWGECMEESGRGDAR